MQLNDSEVASIKLPPYSVEAERSVVGGLMLDPQAWEKVSELVLADDFYRPEHQAIFAVIARLADESEPIARAKFFRANG